MSKLRQLLSTREVAAELHVSLTTVLRLIKSGELVPEARGPGQTGGYLFDPEYINQRKRELVP